MSIQQSENNQDLQDHSEIPTPELDAALTGPSWGVITGQLNETSRKILSNRLAPAGELGQNIADYLQVTQISYYDDDEAYKEHLESPVNKTPLGELGQLLTTELRSILLSQNVPKAQVERTFVKRMGISFGAQASSNGCRRHSHHTHQNGTVHTHESCFGSCDVCP